MNEQDCNELLDWITQNNLPLKVGISLLEHNITKQDLLRIPMQMIISIGISSEKTQANVAQAIQNLGNELEQPVKKPSIWNKMKQRISGRRKSKTTTMGLQQSVM